MQKKMLTAKLFKKAWPFFLQLKKIMILSIAEFQYDAGVQQYDYLLPLCSSILLTGASQPHRYRKTVGQRLLIADEP
jgi:hypothetical protein